jgi:CPA1 family monovalent cation:H+ antiporter
MTSRPAVVFQFCGTFLVWILAERLHLSGHHHDGGSYAMLAARLASEAIPARIRIPSYAVWEVAVFVLNVLAFILVGFQLKSISDAVTGATGARYAAVAAAVCVAVILARIAWVSGRGGVQPLALPPARGRRARPARRRRAQRAGAAVVGWCGMRGTVTLAAALALPTDFPVPRPDPHDGVRRHVRHARGAGTHAAATAAAAGARGRRLRRSEIRLARVETLHAALTAAGDVRRPRRPRSCGTGTSCSFVGRRRISRTTVFGERRRTADGDGAATSVTAAPTAADGDAAVVRAATEAQRRRLVALRATARLATRRSSASRKSSIGQELDWSRLVSSSQS